MGAADVPEEEEEAGEARASGLGGAYGIEVEEEEVLGGAGLAV